MSEKRIVDPDAIKWLIKEGGTVTNETILAMAAEIEMYRTEENYLRCNGCGYNECGMAESGFSGVPPISKKT